MNKQEAINFINSLDNRVNITVTVDDKTLTSGQIEELGISRQLLRYYVKNKYVTAIPSGRQKVYLASDIYKVLKTKGEFNEKN